MKNMRIEFVNETTAKVTKVFEKNAKIYGTAEYKLWREYLKENPGSTMTTKTIKKNPDKKSYRNHTYENMMIFIEVQENGTKLMAEFEKVKKMSKVQNNPYRAVLAWFLEEFEGYDSYKEFFKKLDDDAAAAESAEQAKIQMVVNN